MDNQSHFGCYNWEALCKAYAFDEGMQITFDIRPEDLTTTYTLVIASRTHNVALQTNNLAVESNNVALKMMQTTTTL